MEDTVIVIIIKTSPEHWLIKRLLEHELHGAGQLGLRVDGELVELRHQYVELEEDL